MLSSMVSGREKIRQLWTPLGATLYSNQRPDETTTLPHGFIWNESETPNAFRGWSEDLVHLDIWARSQGEAEQLEDAIVDLDDWSGTSYGNAMVPRWFMQSKTRFQEQDGTWHSTILYLVRYGDKRKVLPR